MPVNSAGWSRTYAILSPGARRLEKSDTSLGNGYKGINY